MTTNQTEIEFHLNKGPTKPFLTIDEQVDLLISRGLVVNDRENAKNILNRTNYYRFSAYSLTLRSEDKFEEGISFDDIYELYCFDDALRRIVLRYSQYVEVAIRSYIAYEHSRLYGPLGYMDNKNFENVMFHLDFIAKLTDEIEKSDDVFVYHHKVDYNNVFPLWVAIECATFGNLSKMYKNLLPDDRMYIARHYFGVGREYIENWLQAIVFARNIAAHGGRFYNRILRAVPLKLDKKHKLIIDRYSTFAYIFAIHKMQPTEALASDMRQDLSSIFEQYPFVRKDFLGFPDNWLEVLNNSKNKKAFGYADGK